VLGEVDEEVADDATLGWGEGAEHLNGERADLELAGILIGGRFVDFVGCEGVGDELSALVIVVEGEEEPGGDEGSEGFGGEEDEVAEVALQKARRDVGPALMLEGTDDVLFGLGFVRIVVAGEGVAAGEDGAGVGFGWEGIEDGFAECVDVAAALVGFVWSLFRHGFVWGVTGGPDFGFGLGSFDDTP